MTFLGLKQDQDFGEPGGTPPARIPRSTLLRPPTPPPPPRLLLAIVPFHLVLLFFRDPFSALLDYPSRDSALTQFIIHALSDAPRTTKVLMNELLYMLKLLSFSITCRRWSTVFFL